MFYYSLRDASSTNSKDRHAGLISNWASQIPHNAKPRSATTPSLTLGSSHSTSRAPMSTHSALTNNIKVSRRDDNFVIVDSDGGLSDRDETNGTEREVAIKSPPKGKQRVSSSVSS